MRKLRKLRILITSPQANSQNSQNSQVRKKDLSLKKECRSWNLALASIGEVQRKELIGSIHFELMPRYRRCPICRDEFEPRNGFERLCYGCYHANSIQDLREQVSILKLQKQRLLDYINQSPSKSLKDDILKGDMLKDALVLCHPDKHGNSERSTRVTQWLNFLREGVKKRKKFDFGF